MKFTVLFIAIAGALLYARCDKPECDCPAFPNGDTVAVSIKEKVNVYNCCKDGFSINFLSVKQDSRCPDGFNCLAMTPLYEGTAKISVKVNLQMVELEIHKPATVRSGSYTYTLLLHELTPHPKSGLPTDPNSYEANIIVGRN